MPTTMVTHVWQKSQTHGNADTLTAHAPLAQGVSHAR